ncbi:hypothetical protein [Devosia sp. RR2S18]|uniref:hypothetical protein n=1 Tax=Devosia rhizosphaerae TaxID=3049774 RepID=UPI00253FDF56|nr:hypothetical protein [Devosia sp. RR2S18]WIJ26344.1 hypothetical protein QOV41_06160 [Devosia sp. RR2S18]
MATPERDTAYNTDTERTVYTRESNGTGWFVGIIVVLALLAIGYLVFSANSGPATGVAGGVPVIEETAPAMDAAPMTEAAPATDVDAVVVPVEPASDDAAVVAVEPTEPVVAPVAQ